MKGKKYGFAIVVLIFALFYLNPSFEKHQLKIGLIPTPPLIENKPVGLKYNSYVFFSTVTNTVLNERLTFGIAGFVFKR
jgi:hypothetical protein